MSVTYVPILSILKFPDSRLETSCDLVREEQRPEAKKLAEQMLEAMYHAGGVGLAAPQVGVPWRMFVMDCQKLKHHIPGVPSAPYFLVNPVIRQISTETISLNEGCLSFPGVNERIVRPRAVVVAWHDVHDWSVKAAEFSNWEARCVQHEVEHLDGKLLVHHMLPAAQKKLRKRGEQGRRL